MIALNWKTVRFIVVGILGALIYFLCSYLLLTYTELPAYISGLLAYAGSFSFAYLGQKIWAFRSVAPHGVTLVRYAVLQLFCALFAATFTQVGVSYSYLSPLVLSALATVFTGGISYIISSSWVFIDTEKQGNAIDDKISNSVVSQHDHKHTLKLNVLATLLWLGTCLLYTYVYYHMPLILSLFDTHDDRLFINLAFSLSKGEWLGDFSQYTLMKGPGYAFFLAFTHIIGLPLFLLVAIFHCLAVSLFSWCLFKLSDSKLFASLIFIVVLLIPLVVSNGRVVRDQIYPDQFLLGLAALIFSLFIANNLLKRSASAMLAGFVIAWFWLTREEGVWILPSVVVLLAYALWQCWHSGQLKRYFLNSVLVLILSFSGVHLVFQYINWQAYDRFIGLDIKEKNFKAALSALQSVREGEAISHVPVTQAAFPRIYSVSPAFSELKHFFDTQGLSWRKHGCGFYPWACDEIAGGWFIWALREAVVSRGYYRTPGMAADYFARVAEEINQACDSGLLDCEKNFLAHMPKITPRDIDSIPDVIDQAYNMLILSEVEPRNISLHSLLSGIQEEKLAVLEFLHSQERFHLDKVVEISGKYAVSNEKLHKTEVKIFNDKGESVPYTAQTGDLIPDSEHFYAFTIRTACAVGCRISLSVDDIELLNEEIPDKNQYYTSKTPLLLGNMQVLFEQLTWKNTLAGVFNIEDKVSYEFRQMLLVVFRVLFPILLWLGLVAFISISLVYVKERRLPTLYVVCAATWIALLVRFTVLLLVHISSFPAIIRLYSMPVYNLLVIASFISLYLFINFLCEKFARQALSKRISC